MNATEGMHSNEFQSECSSVLNTLFLLSKWLINDKWLIKNKMK